MLVDIMKKLYILILSLVSILFFCISSSIAAELAPRKGIGPLDQAKVQKVQAQKWSRMSTFDDMGSEFNDNSTSSTSTTGVGGISGRSKGCVTNVGNVVQKKGLSSGRYGPKNKNDNVVVIKGDVVNVCK